MSEYRKTYPGNLYFVTLTVSGWLDVFNCPLYNDEIIKNLVYCQEKEGLEIYAYVLMSSHLHMVARRDGENDLTELLGRFKSTFTGLFSPWTNHFNYTAGATNPMKAHFNLTNW